MVSTRIQPRPHYVVFDGSMKTTNGVSLNDQLLVGPTVRPPLNDVMFLFVSDNTLMFSRLMFQRCTVLLPSHQKSEIFTGSYGERRLLIQLLTIASATFLATNSVLHFAEQNESKLPLAAKAVKESFYVDDGLPSVKTKQEEILLHHQLQDLFNRGGFKLHKWDSPEVLNLRYQRTPNDNLA